MSHHHLPAKADPKAPQRQRSGDQLARRVAAPLHDAQELGFQEGAPDRDACWARVSPAVRDKVNAKLGELVEWWAIEIDTGISVVAFGTRALVTADPTTNAAGRPAYAVRTVPLDEHTFRSARVTGPGPHGPEHRPEPERPRRAGTKQGIPEPRRGSAVDEQMASFLGHLPARAQQLLQEPFLTSETPLQYDHYYFLTGSVHGLGSGSLSAWCYLTDRQTVTFAAGVGSGYQAPTGATGWDITCWRATVAAARRGAP